MSNYDKVFRSGNGLVDRRDDDDMPEDRDYCYECESSPCRCEELKRVRQEECESYCPTFEDFLIDEHAKQYQGLDDEMADDCDDWIDMLEAHEIQKYAEEYGKVCFRKGQKVGK